MRMNAPADAGDTCTHEGVTYKIEDGAVDLSPAAAAALASHGFTPIGEAVTKAAKPPEGNPNQVRSTLATDRDAIVRQIETADRELLLKMCESVGIEVLKGHTDSVLRKKLLADVEKRMPPRELAPAVVDLRQQPAAVSTEPKPADDPDASFGPKN